MWLLNGGLVIRVPNLMHGKVLGLSRIQSVPRLFLGKFGNIWGGALW